MWLRRRRLRTFLVDSDGDEEIAVVPSEDSPEEDAVPLEEEATSPQSARATPQTPSTEELRAVQSKLEALKEALVKRIEATAFPLNPLDELIDRLGGESRVAEMTGRTHRVLHHRPGVRGPAVPHAAVAGVGGLPPRQDRPDGLLLQPAAGPAALPADALRAVPERGGRGRGR